MRFRRSMCGDSIDGHPVLLIGHYDSLPRHKAFFNISTRNDLRRLRSKWLMLHAPNTGHSKSAALKPGTYTILGGQVLGHGQVSQLCQQTASYLCPVIYKIGSTTLNCYAL